MALLLESWELPVLFRWTFVKQDYRIREILELKSTTETCKSTFKQLTTVSLQIAVLAATEDGSISVLFTIWHGKKNCQPYLLVKCNIRDGCKLINLKN